MAEVIQKIEKQYVGEDCIQMMIPFKKCITILNQDGILFHQMKGSNLLYINKYMEDERRKQFPYYNIPLHNARVGFNVLTYTNQLLEYGKPYIKIGDGKISENYVLKEKDEAVLVNATMEVNKNSKYMTYEEFLKVISKSDDKDEQTYFVYLDGSIPINENEDNLYPFKDFKEAIYNWIQNKLMQNIKDFRDYQEEHSDLVGDYLKENPWFLNYMEACVKNLDLSLMEFNLKIFKDVTLLVIRIKDKDIKIQGIEATFVKEDTFKVDMYDIPVTRYTLEQIKSIPKMNITREPKISLKLNPHVTASDIEEAKQMIRAFRK